MGLVPSAVPTTTPVAKLPNSFFSESLFTGYSPSLCIRPAERPRLHPPPPTQVPVVSRSAKRRMIGGRVQAGVRREPAASKAFQVFVGTEDLQEKARSCSSYPLWLD